MVCVVPLLVTACGGSSTPTAPSTPQSTTFTLSGQVTDSTAGTGISGATITIVDGPNASKSATTDSSGGYSLSGLPSSTFTVSVSAGNYTSHSKSVTLTSNQTVSFQLVRLSATIDGTYGGTLNGSLFPESLAHPVNAPLSVTLAANGASGTWTMTYTSADPPGFQAVTLSGLASATLSGTTISMTLTPNPPTRCPLVVTGTLTPDGQITGTYAAVFCGLDSYRSTGKVTLTRQ
jgi:hypothetical protein